MAEEFADVMAILAEQDFGQNPGKAKGSRKKKFDKSHINEAKAELALELEKRVVNAKFDELYKRLANLGYAPINGEDKPPLQEPDWPQIQNEFQEKEPMGFAYTRDDTLFMLNPTN